MKGDDLQDDINKARKIIDEANKNQEVFSIELQALCKQVAIFYLFFKRDETIACQYLELLRPYIK